MKQWEFVGFVDTISFRQISGWVLYSVPLGGYPIPHLRVNGKDLIELKLTGDRPDVELVKGYPAKGIFLKIARHLDEGINLIEVIFEDGRLVNNGSASLIFNRDQMIGNYWTDQYNSSNLPIARWYQSDFIISAINERVSGENVTGLSQGFNILLKKKYPHILPLKKVISVGSGFGEKEMQAIKSGIFQSVDCFEVSSGAIDKGRKIAQERGLTERILFHSSDPFNNVISDNKYDGVYWNNSLHHMFDSRKALIWSRRVLKPGGLFMMDDYVGPTRMQFSGEMIAISTLFRSLIPQNYLVNPWDISQKLEVKCASPDEDDLFNADPSECADSANIIPALRDIFPMINIQNTGGGVYHLGLSDVLHNIVKANDIKSLNLAMRMDDECTKHGHTQYAIAHGLNLKDQNSSRAP